MKLNSLKIRNFKGIKSFDVEFGDETTITGANGTGKTTVFDAFLWLLFSKDSTGRSEFGIRPLDPYNLPYHGFVLSVEAEVEDNDGTSYVLKKEHHEKIVKNQLRGYTTKYMVDEVDMLKKDYDAFIDEMIDEDKFKMLANLKHFSEKLTWKERRVALIELAGEVKGPAGFGELVEAMGNRKIDDYEDVLKGQKKKLSEKQKEISPRIDEVQEYLDNYAQTDTSDHAVSRKKVEEQIAKLDADREEFQSEETTRQAAIDNLNDLKTKLSARESELLNDTSGTQHFLDKKNEITLKLDGSKNQVLAAQQAVAAGISRISTIECNIKLCKTQRLKPIQVAFKKTTEAQDETKCFNCNADLKGEMLEKANETKTQRLAELTKQGSEIVAEIKSHKLKLTKAQEEIKQLEQSFRNAKITVKDGEKYRDEQFVMIDDKLASKKTSPKEDDTEWTKLNAEIVNAKKAIGEPAGEQLKTLFDDRTSLQNRKAELDKSLAESDLAKKNAKRIKELEAEEKDLAQKIADIEGKLDEIGQYKAAVSKAVEEAVNDKFQHVTFKLFNTILNGSVEDCCVAMLNGVTYDDCSTGQKILIGIDIISVLSEHYGLSVPLFIDNFESMTLPVEFNGQLIKLMADDVNELNVS